MIDSTSSGSKSKYATTASFRNQLGTIEQPSDFHSRNDFTNISIHSNTSRRSELNFGPQV